MAMNQSWRVAVVTETYPPEINGVARTIHLLVEGMRARGHHVEVTRPRQPHEAKDGLHGVAAQRDRLTRSVCLPRYPELRMGWESINTLLERWIDDRPDLVHIATEGPLGWAACHAARTLDIPVSSDFRTNFDVYSKHYGTGWLAPVIRRYLRHFHNMTQLTMVPNAGLKNKLTAQGFRRLKVIGRGVDSSVFSPDHRRIGLRDAWGVGSTAPVFLSVGRLAAEKNLELLLQSWAAICSHEPSAKLVIVGDGPMRARVQAQLTDAIFLGAQRGQALSEIYASSDVFLFPSLSETYGNVVPEAMASGLAVLAFDEAAAHEWINHEVNGVVVPSGDRDVFIQLACELATNPQWRDELRTQARLEAKRRDWNAIFEAIENHWRQLLPRERLDAQHFSEFHFG